VDESLAATAAFYASLATKRIAAGLVCRDDAGQVLIVKPVYKAGWSIPGGAVEALESPAAGAAREATEELGLEIAPGRLVVVAWAPATPPKTEGLEFLFDGGVLPKHLIERIRLPPDELSAWRFVPFETATELVSPRLGASLLAAQRALDAGATVYLDDGRDLTEDSPPDQA
jgi:8-oxo-dGTP pyrophosphatase MutT (NUDIX family)